MVASGGAGGHAWLLGGVWLLGGGGMHGCSGGACVVFARGHAWFFLGGACVVFSGGPGGVHRIRRDTVNERAVRILLECILVLQRSFTKQSAGSALGE